MAYQQYPPQPPQYPQQPFPQPGAPAPQPGPAAPPPQQAFQAAPAGPVQPTEISKLGQFGLFTFIAVAASLGLALFGWVLSLAKVASAGHFNTFAGFFGTASLTLLGLTIVLRLLDRK